MTVPFSERFKKILPGLISLLTISILVYFVIRNVDRIKNLFNLSLRTGLILALLVAISVFLNGIVNFLLYQNLNVPIPFLSSIGLSAINSLANQLPFAGGLVAKGVYLKRRYHLSYVKYLSATAALYICYFVTNGLVGLVVLAYLSGVNGYQIPGSLVVGFLLMIGSLVFLWVPLQMSFLPERWRSYLENIRQGWSVLRKKKRLLLSLIVVQMIAVLIMSARFWLSFNILSQNIGIVECLLFSTATILTRLISIAPGGLGVREGIVAGLSTILGFNPGVSAVAVGFDRLIATAVIAVTGSIFSYFLSKDVLEYMKSEKVDEA